MSIWASELTVQHLSAVSVVAASIFLMGPPPLSGLLGFLQTTSV